MNSQDSDEEKTLSNSVTWHNRYLERRKEPSGSTQENAVKLKQATAVDSTHKSVRGTWHTGIQWLWLLVKGTCNPRAHQCVYGQKKRGGATELGGMENNRATLENSFQSWRYNWRPELLYNPPIPHNSIPYGNKTQDHTKICRTHTYTQNLQPYHPGHISSQKLGKLDLVSTCMGDLFTFILIYINVFMFCLHVCVKASSDSLKLEF